MAHYLKVDRPGRLQALVTTSAPDPEGEAWEAGTLMTREAQAESLPLERMTLADAQNRFDKACRNYHLILTEQGRFALAYHQAKRERAAALRALNSARSASHNSGIFDYPSNKETTPDNATTDSLIAEAPIEINGPAEDVKTIKNSIGVIKRFTNAGFEPLEFIHEKGGVFGLRCLRRGHTFKVRLSGTDHNLALVRCNRCENLMIRVASMAKARELQGREDWEICHRDPRPLDPIQDAHVKKYGYFLRGKKISQSIAALGIKKYKTPKEKRDAWRKANPERYKELTRKSNKKRDDRDNKLKAAGLFVPSVPRPLYPLHSAHIKARGVYLRVLKQTGRKRKPRNILPCVSGVETLSQ
ncbi:hypothetical protein [Erwinia sp. S59]|uniref:hypothetical protein n=1 Tax=Erwinia sp. S59 TaxID=2769340 RepID=UPI00190996A3|nr:hypothetical protein [Erwinia sp. S59]MBK0092813.1 hypothetical protein [Erwinia sp. S59]